MRVLPLLLACGAAAALWFGILDRPAPVSGPEAVEAPAGGASQPEVAVREPKRGTLVVRVRTEDGSPLPPGTQAGYLVGRMERVRSAADDGTFRFADAPLGDVELIAKADGYRLGSGRARVVAGLSTEAVVVLVPER